MKSQIFKNFLDLSMYRQIQFKIVLRFFCSTPNACYLWPEEKGFLSRWETHALTWKRISISCVHFCLLLLPQGWRIRNHYTLLFFTGKTFPLGLFLHFLMLQGVPNFVLCSKLKRNWKNDPVFSWILKLFSTQLYVLL